jgi:hypothetical protein
MKLSQHVTTIQRAATVACQVNKGQSTIFGIKTTDQGDLRDTQGAVAIEPDCYTRVYHALYMGQVMTVGKGCAELTHAYRRVTVKMKIFSIRAQLGKSNVDDNHFAKPKGSKK